MAKPMLPIGTTGRVLRDLHAYPVAVCDHSGHSALFIIALWPGENTPATNKERDA